MSTTAAAPLSRPAQASVTMAGLAALSLGSFATVWGWLHPVMALVAAAACSLSAIACGHIGRFRGKRLAGAGRRAALLGIVLGWLGLTICAVALALYLGLIVGVSLLLS
ncbi:hypothetical protein ACIBG8_14710 [Nonomuraea sp. NPDC050556]|uniref:hypothetical protein n=1 Tax=Nonomuraea sp. NPDC050556 TaxID=3364369 RepID=UPI0037B8B3CA